MRLHLRTRVAQPPLQVWEGFTEALFLQLKPPGVGLRLLRFDGCKKGDVVAMQLHFGLFKQLWTSYITEDQQTEEECFFVDESKDSDLPFFLKSWKHRHGLRSDGEGGCWIEDEIEYRAPLGLNYLLWPMLWAQFAWRKPVYRRVFGRSPSR